jgi:hypothetical protein
VTAWEGRIRQTQARVGHGRAGLINVVIGVLRYAGFTNIAHGAVSAIAASPSQPSLPLGSC